MVRALLIFSLFWGIPISAETATLISAAYLPENVEKYKKDKPTGRDFEIFTEIMKCTGEDFKIEIQPYMRHVKTFKANKTYGGVMTVPTMLEIEDTFPTESYIAYQNGVFVREEDFPKGVQSLEDLKDKHVITFIGAKDLLKGVEEKISTFASYTENTTQYNHNELLVKKRTDAVFSDGLIFMAHHSRLLEKKNQFKSVKVKFYPLFKNSYFKAVFRSKKLANDFNRCNKQLSEKGTLDIIEKVYALKYQDSLGKEFVYPLLHTKSLGRK